MREKVRGIRRKLACRGFPVLFHIRRPAAARGRGASSSWHGGVGVYDTPARRELARRGVCGFSCIRRPAAARCSEAESSWHGGVGVYDTPVRRKFACRGFPVLFHIRRPAAARGREASSSWHGGEKIPGGRRAAGRSSGSSRGTAGSDAANANVEQADSA